MIIVALENNLALFYKVNQKLTTWPNNPTHRYLFTQKKWKYISTQYICPQIHNPQNTLKYTTTHNSFIHCRLQFEITQISISIWGINKMYHIHTMEWYSQQEIKYCYVDINEPQKYYADTKRPDERVHTI